MSVAFRKAIIGFAALAVVLFTFFFYSAVVNFGNWPWTRAEMFTDSHLGFAVSSDKQHAFRQAIDLQQQGIIVALRLLDAAPTTYAEKYKGTPIHERDFGRVSLSNRWYLPLSECNCWLVLEFANGQLANITRFEYRGPTI